MVRRKLTAFAIDPDLAAGLKFVKARDGLSESEQIRRALRAFLQERRALQKKKTERPRAITRKRS